MRTTAVLVILMLAFSLNLGASIALAGDNTVIQPLPSACQPLSDVELSQMRGTFLDSGSFKIFLLQSAYALWVNKVPTKFKQSPVGQYIEQKYFTFYFQF